MSQNRVTMISLDKAQSAFIGRPNCNGVGIVSGSVDRIGAVLAQVGAAEDCIFLFSTHCSPNLKRTFNAYVKRAHRIAEVAGVSLGEPQEYFIDGFRQDDKWAIPVVAGGK